MRLKDLRRTHFDFARAAAAILTVIFLITGQIRWPTAIVLLVLCCEFVKFFDE